MRLRINAHQYINIAIRAEVIAQDRPKHRKLGDAPAFAKFSDFLAGKNEFLSSHGGNYSTLANLPVSPQLHHGKCY